MKKKPETKIKKGRPSKFKEEYVEQAGRLSLLGQTTQDLADFFKVNKDTITEWKNVYPDFSVSIKNNKDIFDTGIMEATLLHRARGYSHEEEKVFQCNGEIITHNTMKHYPPDTTALIFWLKNRNPDRWREKQEIEHSGEIGAQVIFNLPDNKRDDEEA